MGFLSKALRIFSRKQTVDYSTLLEAYYGDKTGELGKSYPSLVRNGYKKNGIVYSGLRKIIVSGSSVPWKVVQTQGTEETDVPPSHILSRLITNPNLKQGHGSFFEQLICQLFLAGKTFILKGLAGNETRYIWNLRPDWVTKENEKNPESRWVYEVPGVGKKLYNFEEIFGLYLFDPLSDKDGLSPLLPAALTIDQANCGRLWNRNLLRREARPSGIIKSKYLLENTQVKEIIDTFMHNFGGSENAGKPVFLKGDVDFIPTSFQPAQMEFLDGQRLADRNTATTIGVPSQLLGDKDAATYSNYAEARKSFYEETVIPLLLLIVEEFNVNLVSTPYPNYKYGLALDKVPALQENQTETWSRVDASGELTINEKRKAKGLPALDGEAGEIIELKSGGLILSDGTVLVSAGLVPIDQVIEPPPPMPDPNLNPPNPPTNPPDPNQDPNNNNNDPPPDDSGDSNSTDNTNGKKSGIRSKFFKAVYCKGFDRSRTQYILTSKNLLRKFFQNERKTIANLLQDGKTEEAVAYPTSSGQEKKLTDIYFKIYYYTGANFARRTLQNLPKNAFSLETKAGSSRILDLWAKVVKTRILEEAGDKIKGIGQTTKEKVRKTLATGVSAGEGISDLIKRVDGLYLEQIIPNRSEVIARTETISASNSGSHWAAGISGLELQKEWLTVMDGRERESHGAMNGETAGMDEYFEVNGSKLLYPGDMSKNPDPAEVCQCRCVVLYNPIGD